MSSKRVLFGAGIAACALLVCIGAFLVISTAAATDADTATSNETTHQIAEGAASGSAAENISGAQHASGQENPAQATDTDIVYGQGAQGSLAAGAAPTSICTISIDCSAALENPGKLSADIMRSLPSNGLMLAPSQIALSEGSTALDVLKDACSMTGIPIDCTGGFLGSSTYVRSIGSLGEFDCGPESGWTYTVNGQMIPASASDCKIQPGDVLIWSYTCSL